MYTCVLSDMCSEVVTMVDVVNLSLCHHLVNKSHVSINGETADELKTDVDKLPEHGVNPELNDTRVKGINIAGNVNEK